MDLLVEQAHRFGFDLTPEQCAAFQIYYDELVIWNERAGLTAITGLQAVQIKHFLDSLTCLLAFPAGTYLRVIDVGSGAGFPGLPIKIMRPYLRLALLESVGKKADFLRHIVARLGLTNVVVLQGRAEDYGHRPEHREQYDVVVARAVAELRILVELTLPFCRVGGRVIAQKKIGIEEEIQNAARATAILGGTLQACYPISLPDTEPRQLVVLEKISPTPPRYPRRPGIPEKRPL